MNDKELINKCESDLADFGSLMKCQATDLLESCKNLIEQNAELKKRLAKLDDERIFIANEYFDGTETRR